MHQLEKQFHIRCTSEDIGRYCILPGDPGRVPAIAALFEDDSSTDAFHNIIYIEP